MDADYDDSDDKDYKVGSLLPARADTPHHITSQDSYRQNDYITFKTHTRTTHATYMRRHTPMALTQRRKGMHTQNPALGGQQAGGCGEVCRATNGV